MLPGKDSFFAIELVYLFVTLLRVSPKASGAANWLLFPQVAQILLHLLHHSHIPYSCLLGPLMFWLLTPNSAPSPYSMIISPSPSSYLPPPDLHH